MLEAGILIGMMTSVSLPAEGSSMVKLGHTLETRVTVDYQLLFLTLVRTPASFARKPVTLEVVKHEVAAWTLES
jgi:hypothetical protein